MATAHKKYKSEVNELHDALLHCKREYDLLRIEYEQLTKSNEQSGKYIVTIVTMKFILYYVDMCTALLQWQQNIIIFGRWGQTKNGFLHNEKVRAQNNNF